MKVMKKSKLQLLLFFLHHSELTHTRDNLITYSQLYTNLTLASSTVRGIVQEFLSAGILRRIYSEDMEGFLLSSRGESLARDDFPGLYQSDEETDGQVLVVPKNSQIQCSGRYIQLDTHTFFLFDGSQRQRSRAALGTPITASEKSIVDWWWSTVRGKAASDRRAKLVRLSQQISLQIRSASPKSERGRGLKDRFLQELISAAQSKLSPPEVYYPHQMRLDTLLTHFWKA